MKIKTLYFKDVGPLKEQEIDLTDSWAGDIAELILFSGPNGTGKSIILRMIAMLWEAETGPGSEMDKRQDVQEVREEVTGEVTREVTREVTGEVTGVVAKLLDVCRSEAT